MIRYDSPYFNWLKIPSELAVKTGLTVSGSSFENNKSKKGASIVSDTREKIIDNTLNTR
jgi:hypothetical protein